MKNERYNQLVAKMHEIAIVPPQEIGPFTGVYRIATSRLKVAPWKTASLFAFTAALFLYIILGPTLIRVVSLLQYGF